MILNLVIIHKFFITILSSSSNNFYVFIRKVVITEFILHI